MTITAQSIKSTIQSRLLEMVESRHELIKHAQFLSDLGISVRESRLYIGECFEAVVEYYLQNLCGKVTTHSSKNQKKLDRFFEVQNRNHTTPIYCAAYWPTKRLRADFMEHGGFCVKNSLLSALWGSPKAEKSNDMMRLSQTHSTCVDGQPR